MRRIVRFGAAKVKGVVSARRGGAALAAGFVVFAAAALGIAGRGLDRPGLNYDEVIQAEPARQFLDEDGSRSSIPGAQSVRAFGRWIPLMVQPYMGALKSLVLIPGFALFGASGASLRIITLCIALVGLGLFMVWSRRVFSLPVALTTGALLAVDPSFLLVSRHDWGSFAIGLLCRGGGVLFLTSGFASRSALRLFAGGVFLGLGIYNKIDFVVFVAAAGLALLAVAPGAIAAVTRTRLRTALAAPAGALLGAAPMIASLPAALAMTRAVFRRQASDAGAADFPEKLHALAATLDGSYFHELMLAGGRFDAMGRIEGAATGPFLVIFAACALALVVRLLRVGVRNAPAEGFALLTVLFALVGILATPRAVRIHHALNLYPFPQLVVAIVLVRLSRLRVQSAALRHLPRAVACVAVLAAIGGSLRIDALSLATIRETGGKGRWSDALGAFAAEIEGRPGSVVVSLDWGFDGPLRFEDRGLRLREPIWRMRRARKTGKPWKFSGTPRHVYLVYESDYAVFGYGKSLLEAIGELPPGTVSIRRHLDREGDVAFLSIRFARDHWLAYDGSFKVDIQ